MFRNVVAKYLFESQEVFQTTVDHFMAAYYSTVYTSNSNLVKWKNFGHNILYQQTWQKLHVPISNLDIGRKDVLHSSILCGQFEWEYMRKKGFRMCGYYSNVIIRHLLFLKTVSSSSSITFGQIRLILFRGLAHLPSLGMILDTWCLKGKWIENVKSKFAELKIRFKQKIANIHLR